MTLQDLLRNAETEMEKNLLTALWGELKNYIEEGSDFSDTGIEELSNLLPYTINQVKGIVGSLVKKDILYTEETGTGYDVVLINF